ncbi:hypothetical protein AYO37_00595 [Opitutia bacterium SCGC AG-212-L18]|nr:hypothetical protein AYO37_00595 [Opitutae bacterium SCGC AG-212-L18]
MKTKITKAIILLSLLFLSINNFAFSTNLDDDSEYNVIHLIGEIHNKNLIGEIHNAKCMKFRNELLKEAIDNNIILALEGTTFGKSINSNTFGIEEKRAHLLIMQSIALNYILLYRDHIENYKFESDPLNELKEIIYEKFSPLSQKIEMLSFLVLHNYNLDSIMIDENNVTIFRKLLNLISKSDLQSLLSGENPQGELAQVFDTHSLEKPFFLNIHPNTTEWLKFYKDTINSYYQAILEQLKQNPEFTLNPRYQPLIDSADMLSIQFSKPIKMLLEDLLDIRNHIFLENIITLFETNKPKQKPFYAVVGLDHTPFLIQKLKEKGFPVKFTNSSEED